MPEEDEDEGTPFGQDDNIFGSSKAAKGLFDESEDEEKKPSGGLFSGQKSKEETTEDFEEASTPSVGKQSYSTYCSEYCTVPWKNSGWFLIAGNWALQN